MNAELCRELAALGLTLEQVCGVVGLIERRDAAYLVKEEERKALIRARVQRFRSKNKEETLRNVTGETGNVTKQLTRAEDSSSNQQISEQGRKKDTSPPARSARGTRIPDDFKPDIEAAISEGLPRQEAERQALSFCDYWRSKPGAAALKLDWSATWRMWFRRRIDERPRPAASQGPPDRPPRNAGEAARLELLRRETIDAPSTQIRHDDQSDGSPGFAGTGIARRIALASSR
jgi:hypothetical protein